MKKFLIGCGALVGLVVIGGIITSIIAVNWLKKEMPDTDWIEEQQSAMIEMYGEPEDYVPPLDGRTDPERVAVFIDVRSGLRGEEEAFEETVLYFEDFEEHFEEAGFVEKIKLGMRAAKEGMGVATHALNYIGTRDSLLLEEDMSRGEYIYLFSVGAICYLDWNPDPVSDFGEEEDFEDLDETAAEGRRQMRSIFRQQLRNALTALNDEQAAGKELSPQEREFQELLESTLERGRIGSDFFPLAEGLPHYMSAPFEARQAEFEAVLPLSSEALALEMLSHEEDDHDGIQVDFDSN